MSDTEIEIESEVSEELTDQEKLRWVKEWMAEKRNKQRFLELEVAALQEEIRQLKNLPNVEANQSSTMNNLPKEQFEIIFKHVLEYFNVKELLKMRLVCKLWRHEVQKELVNERTIYFGGECGRWDFRVNIFNLNALVSFPLFQRFKLSLNWEGCFAWPKEQYRNLMMIHGKYLQILQLSFNSKEFKIEDLRDVFLPSLDCIRQLELNFPCSFIHDEQMYFPNHGTKILHNLTWLTITVDNKECEDSPHKNTLVFQDILLLSPNLETLYWRAVGNGKDSERDRTRHFVESLIAVNPPQLQNLFIYNRVTPTLAEALLNSQLIKLRRLYLVDVKTFRLDLAPGKNVVTPKLAQYTGGQGIHNGLVLKSELEKLLDARGDVPCTILLESFLGALTERNING